MDMKAFRGDDYLSGKEKILKKTGIHPKSSRGVTGNKIKNKQATELKSS